jgi:hypothetical protein
MHYKGPCWLLCRAYWVLGQGGGGDSRGLKAVVVALLRVQGGNCCLRALEASWDLLVDLTVPDPVRWPCESPAMWSQSPEDLVPTDPRDRMSPIRHFCVSGPYPL